MGVALTELRRARLKYGLLAAAVALLVFLVLFLWTLSGSLVGSFVGALRVAELDGIAYSADARDNVQASRLAPGVVADVAAVPGVAAASGWSVTTLTGEVGGEPTDLGLFGVDPRGAGAPGGLTDGRLPAAPDETAVDAGGAVGLGDTIVLRPSGIELTVVGLLRGAQFLAQPAAYVDARTYQEVVLAANPEAPFVPVNAVAFRVEPGSDPAEVAAAVAEQVPGLSGYTRDGAIDVIPGIDQVGSTFGILIGATFLIAVVVVGFFFLILTVQKQKVFTLLRALGRGTPAIAGGIAMQIVVVVIAASAIAVLFTLLAVRALDTGIPVSLSAGQVVAVVLGVLVFSLLAGLVSVSRVARIDPADAAGAR